jgi:signal peptidase I
MAEATIEKSQTNEQIAGQAANPPPGALRHQVIANLLRDKASLSAGACRFCVTSTSMYPLLTVGDWVVVESVEFDAVQRGDLLLYESGDHFNCHRLMRKLVQNGTRLLLTKGDSSLSFDPAWEPAALLGRVVAVEKTTQCVRLDTWKWQATNRILAFLSEWQASLWRICSSIERAILGSGKTKPSPLLARFLHAPARLWLRVVLAK